MLALEYARRSGRDCIKHLHGSPRRTEKILWLRGISAAAGRNHSRRPCWSRCVCADADRRREIAVLSAAGFVAQWDDDCGVAVDRVDEGPGRRAANKRDRGDVLEFVAGW